MMEIRILFFDDLPGNSENMSLILNIARKLPDCRLITADSVNTFEKRVKQCDCDIIILDIMATSPKNFIGLKSKQPVDNSKVGIELLIRCREGYYGNKYKDSPIYMRSTRREASIIAECRDNGATKCFSPGFDDMKLIEKIKKDIANINGGYKL